MNGRASPLHKRFSTLVQLLQQRALLQGSRTAYTFLVDGELQESGCTYASLDRRARAIGAQLQMVGAFGERVLLLYPSGLDYIAAFFACLYAGAVAVPVYPPDPARIERTLPRLLAIVRDSSPKIVLTDSQIAASAQALVRMSPQLHSLYWITSDTIPDDLSLDWRQPAISSETIAFLQYTSGSTAEPRGVVLTHGMLLYNGDMIQEAFEHTEQSTFVGWAPLYHDLGLIGNVLQPLHIGARCILMSPLTFLQKPFRWLNAISHYRARTSGGPNFAYELCVRKVNSQQRQQLDLSSWEIAFNGAEPVRPQTLENFCKIFEPCGFRRETFYPCYGLAEATVFVSGGWKSEPYKSFNLSSSALEQQVVKVIEPGDEGARWMVSCGMPWLAEKVIIVDPETRMPCPPARVGEIWVSGPNIASGYWQRQQETNTTFGAYLADSGEGPFLRTGDLGFFMEEQLIIAGRIKDLIIIDGLNHYPQDIELTVDESHPALRPGCSAAFSVEIDGREVLVIVAEVDGRRLLAEQQEAGEDGLGAARVIRAITQAVSLHHDLSVHEVVLLKSRTIPKTSSGKIQRQASRLAYRTGDLELWRPGSE